MSKRYRSSRRVSRRSQKSSNLWVWVLAIILLICLIPVGQSSSSSHHHAEQTQSQSESSARGEHLKTVQKPKSESQQRAQQKAQDQSSDSSADSNSSSTMSPAETVLNTLAVKGRAPKTGYRRTQFGPAWADVDHNGCDTRNDILNRDLTDRTWREGTHDCIVTSGILHDPYTGTVIHFTRGRRTSEAVQIDHVVALSDAWQTGAQQLDESTREDLANDPLNLLAVDGPANQQKSDSDAASWLPANKAFRCDYVARQIAVKKKYRLWVTAAEKDAMAHVLTSCPTQKVPVQ
jgi:hypothetical protein